MKDMYKIDANYKRLQIKQKQIKQDYNVKYEMKKQYKISHMVLFPSKCKRHLKKKKFQIKFLLN